MPTLTVNGQQITVEKGTTLIQAAEQLGIAIPRYCYHPGLSVAGNCRMCMVEVEKMPKPQISCHIQCQEGMVVHTESDKVKKLRQHVLEFLLVNHPLDCPVCDQSGECGLQNYYMQHGLYDSRVNENKVKKKAKAKPIGPTIILDSERCVLCSRCVRFSDEISKTGEFGIFNRGDRSEIGVCKEVNHKYSGNLADICPVGALTDRDFRFKCRVWYLSKAESICPGCARGCNISLEVNLDRPQHGHGERVMRLKPRFNDDVNDWWMCDEGRYGYKFVDHDRIDQPTVRVNGQVKNTDWNELIHQFLKSFQAVKPENLAVLISAQLTNEELFLAKQLFVEELKIKRVHLIRNHHDGYQDDFLLKADKHPNRKGAEWMGFIETEEQTNAFFEELKQGHLKGLIIFGQDLISLFPERNVTDCLNRLAFSAFIGSNHNVTSERASYVFPAATYAEKNGTFSNFEGRVQLIHKALPNLGASKAESEILIMLAQKLHLGWSYQNEKDVFKKLSESIHPFQGLDDQKIGREGIRP